MKKIVSIILLGILLGLSVANAAPPVPEWVYHPALADKIAGRSHHGLGYAQSSDLGMAMEIADHHGTGDLLRNIAFARTGCLVFAKLDATARGFQSVKRDVRQEDGIYQVWALVTYRDTTPDVKFHDIRCLEIGL